MTVTGTEKPASSIGGGCFAARVRLISRVVTNIYDDAFRHLGVKTSQLNILVVTKHLGVARPAVICEILALDTSTLSRNVDRMRKSGWLEIVPEPGRSQPFQLTTAGQELIRQAEPAWTEAQEKAREMLGNELVQALSKPMSDLCPQRREE
jgi:DNA-binding MarR family transcriptional regulator